LAGGRGLSAVEWVDLHMEASGGSAGERALVAEALTAAGGTDISNVTNRVGSVARRS
jgi:hypothetical protein